MRRLAAAVLLLLLLCSGALAQQAVNVIGAVTPGHCVSFFSQTQITDAGGNCGIAGGVGSVSGTAGQINVSPTTGAVVVSLPATITANLTVSGTINNTGTFQIGGTTVTLPISLANGGTNNAALTASAGGIVWSDATKLNVLAGTVTAGQCLLSGNLATPSWGSCSALTLPVSLANGGTNNALTASAGGIVWSDASKLNILAGTSTAGQCLLSGNLVSPSWATCPGGGGTPGGANTNVQFNNSSAFGGDSGFTYAGAGQVTHALGTITTNLKALTITGTFNAVGTTFDAPLLMNITNTASAAASALFDFQVGGTSLLILQPNTNAIMSLGDGATASAFRVYNTVDTLSGPANYERAAFDWTTTAGTLTVGTQKGGTGSNRSVNFVATAPGGFQFLAAGTSTVTIASAGLSVSSNLLNFSGGANGIVLSEINASSVLQISAGVGTANGWINWGGEARVTSDFSVTSSTTLVNVTGLSVAVKAGRTYHFEAGLYVTDAAAGGVQAAIAGTATATAIQYIGYAIADNAIKAKTNATALATAVASTVTTETTGILVRITGTITVNAAGTLTVQMAQNTSNATATIAKQGSYFIVHDMP